MVRERGTPWGVEPPQPLDRQLDHTIAVIIRRMKMGSKGSDNLHMQRDEAFDWAKSSLKISK